MTGTITNELEYEIRRLSEAEFFLMEVKRPTIAVQSSLQLVRVSIRNLTQLRERVSNAGVVLAQESK